MSDEESGSGIEPRKRCGIDQDPDYHEAAPPDRKKLKLMEDTGKYCVGEKVKHILTKCFDEEIERQENEIKQIDEAIFNVQQKLQILRNVALQNFFSGKRNLNVMPGSDPACEPMIHPAVKESIGKRPAGTQPCLTEAPNHSTGETSQEVKPSASQEEVQPSADIRIPRYVPPRLPEVIAAVPIRGEHRCSRKKIHIGNVSKWIPVIERTDNSSHRWMVYVRGTKENPDISSFVKRVVFYLHPSYAPHDVVQVSSYPFHVTRRGWGEFPLRVQLFFSDPLSKPVNIIHNLKLDRTYSSIQTLGAETVVEVFVNDHTAPLTQSHENNESNEDHSQGESADSLLQRLEQSASEDMDICMTESEPPSHQNIVLKDLSTIKTEKVDENFTVENETLANKGSAATQSIPSLNNHYQSIVVKTEKIDQDLPKSENPSPMMRENKNSSATPPKIIQIKSCLPLNAGAPIRLMAPGTSVTFPNRMISPSLIRPMIVRCVNKEGVPIRLPINLLRNAIVVRPSRLIRPGESLLRAPLLRPPISTCVPKAQPQPKPEVLNIPKTEIISRTNDKENFEDTVLAVEWLDTRDCVRKLAQNIHIIDSRANEPGFRSRHPFTCPSLETFASWNIGKQRSCEWLRARAIRELLSKCKIKQKEPLWSVKVILRWCRHHGYSPMTNNPIKPKPGTTASFDSTVTACQLKSLDNPDESDCVIDIESLPTGTRVPACSRVSETIILNSDDPDLTQWITQQLKKFGYQLSPEVCGDALVNFTSILFTRLWKSFADDLLRRSLSESWARQSGSNPDEITLADAFRAIVHRPEFDLFTNAGLCLPTDSTRSIN